MRPVVNSKSARRDWLKVTGAAVAGAICSQLRAEESDSDDRITLGFSTYGMKTIPTERAIELLVEIGYDAVELAVRAGWDADSATMTPARRRSLRGRIADAPLRLRSLMEHVMPSDEKKHAEAMERLRMAGELAHDLAPDDPPIVQTVLGGGKFEATKEVLRDRLGQWVEVADATETTIAIKPHRGGIVSRPSEAVWLIEQLGKPLRLGIVYDYSHYIFRGMSMEQTIRQALPYTAHVAVKDAVEENGRVTFRLPGEVGTIDFAALIKQFHAGGYRGDINCEVSGMVSGQNGYDPIAAAKTCYRNLNAAFARAQIARS